MDDGDGRRRHPGVREGLPAAHRHAGERGVSPACSAKPAATFPSRDDWLGGTAEQGGGMNKMEVKAPAGRLHESTPHDSAIKQVAGRAEYVDDIAEPEGTLHAYLGLSTKA